MACPVCSVPAPTELHSNEWFNHSEEAIAKAVERMETMDNDSVETFKRNVAIAELNHLKAMEMTRRTQHALTKADLNFRTVEVNFKAFSVVILDLSEKIEELTKRLEKAEKRLGEPLSAAC